MNASTVVPLLFETPDIIKTAAVLIGLVESVDQKVDKLLKKDFNVGLRTLNELKNAKTQHEYLLRKGWDNFQAAINNETGKRKAMAYLCLAYCQHRMGEKKIAYSTLKEFTNWEYQDPAGRVKRGALKLRKGGALIGKAVSFLDQKGRLSKFNALVSEERIEKSLQGLNNHFSKLSSEEAVKELQFSTSQYLTEKKRRLRAQRGD